MYARGKQHETTVVRRLGVPAQRGARRHGAGVQLEDAQGVSAPFVASQGHPGDVEFMGGEQGADDDDRQGQAAHALGIKGGDMAAALGLARVRRTAPEPTCLPAAPGDDIGSTDGPDVVIRGEGWAARYTLPGTTSWKLPRTQRRWA